MKILSYNVNGIRAALRKGILEWIDQNKFDILCFQELKAHEEQLDLGLFQELGYQCYINQAEKKGYSGVSIFSRIKASEVIVDKGKEGSQYYNEGRYISADFDDFQVVNCYFPSGSSGELRQEVKMGFLEDYLPHFQQLAEYQKPVLVCGDFNIAHKEIDIHDPIKNANSTGFRPEEREWMDEYFDLGFTDCFRKYHNEPDRYSWWSLRTRARERNRGWRIDYITTNNKFTERMQDCDLMEDVMFSDHCPVIFTFNN